MRYIYHYHAKATKYGCTYELDGIVDAENPINNIGEYRNLKERILSLGNPDLTGAKCTIRSLTLLQSNK